MDPASVGVGAANLELVQFVVDAGVGKDWVLSMSVGGQSVRALGCSRACTSVLHLRL